MVKRYRKEDPNSYALGATLTIELLKCRPNIVNAVYYHSQCKDVTPYETLCKAHGIPFIQSDKAFNILSQKENCFVLADFQKQSFELVQSANHLLLVNPSNAGNLGTILRSAAAFGVEDVAVIAPAVDLYDPKTVRSSMGAVFHLRVKYYDSLSDYRREAGERHFYPFMLKATETLKKVTPLYPCTLVFGNEATGLPDEYLSLGTPVIIRHTANVDSLNLPIAASIALFQFFSETDD
ncbi:MAG: RNA methyltransferase [Clostridia bacterium]|nr:RNA methyltransferase [Clostridia bacterium]